MGMQLGPQLTCKAHDGCCCLRVWWSNLVVNCNHLSVLAQMMEEIISIFEDVMWFFVLDTFIRCDVIGVKLLPRNSQFLSSGG